MSNNDKRKQREWKRELKRAGNKKRRLRLKRDLEANPDEAHQSFERLGRFRTEGLNGTDHDSTRLRHQPDEEE